MHLTTSQSTVRFHPVRHGLVDKAASVLNDIVKPVGNDSVPTTTNHGHSRSSSRRNRSSGNEFADSRRLYLIDIRIVRHRTHFYLTSRRGDLWSSILYSKQFKINHNNTARKQNALECIRSRHSHFDTG